MLMTHGDKTHDKTNPGLEGRKNDLDLIVTQYTYGLKRTHARGPSLVHILTYLKLSASNGL